jgi:hypothetical protein
VDNAVALVQTYLRVNGYFTVSEFPVLEAMGPAGFRMVTDVDILAFRFPGAGMRVSGGTGSEADRGEVTFAVDPLLATPGVGADMLMGEVKEGRAELNRGATDPTVVAAVLSRFGCCPARDAAVVARILLRDGAVLLPSGHRLRMLIFGSVSSPARPSPVRVIPLGHVVRFLEEYLQGYWEILHHADFKDPAFGMLMTLEKARRANGRQPKHYSPTVRSTPRRGKGPAGK